MEFKIEVGRGTHKGNQTIAAMAEALRLVVDQRLVDGKHQALLAPVVIQLEDYLADEEYAEPCPQGCGMEFTDTSMIRIHMGIAHPEVK